MTTLAAGLRRYICYLPLSPATKELEFYTGVFAGILGVSREICNNK